jgi:hypothetical protein
MEIYIMRDNHEFGPYSREAALEYVKQGIFETLDQACYAGMTEWKTVGELLGINGDSKPGRGPVLGSANKITEFNPTWVHTNGPRRRKPGSGVKTAFMILLNGILILIVATAAYVRWGGGSRMVRRCLYAMSVELAKLANAGLEDKSTPAPATAGPEVAKAPPAAAAPEVAPGTAGAASPVPALAAASSPAAAAASTSTLAPAAASSPVAASSPAAVAASTPVLAAASAPAGAAESTPASAVTSAPALAVASAPASTPNSAASPVPAPAAASTPAQAPAAAPTPAQPQPFDITVLAGNPSAWPKKVKLKQAVIFPALYNSQVVGSVTAPAGTSVNLVNIQGDQLILDYNGGTQTLSWKQTDIEEEAAKAGGLVAPPTAEAPAASTGPPSGGGLVVPPVPPQADAPAASSAPGATAGTPAGN